MLQASEGNVTCDKRRGIGLGNKPSSMILDRYYTVLVGMIPRRGLNHWYHSISNPQKPLKFYNNILYYHPTMLGCSCHKTTDNEVMVSFTTMRAKWQFPNWVIVFFAIFCRVQRLLPAGLKKILTWSLRINTHSFKMLPINISIARLDTQNSRRSCSESSVTIAQAWTQRSLWRVDHLWLSALSMV